MIATLEFVGTQLTGGALGTASHTHTIEDDDATAANPLITISGGSAVTEGTAATFTVTATPAPSTTKSVSVTVSEDTSGGQEFVAAGNLGTHTVSIPTSGTATLSITTVGDSTDEPNGAVTATVQSGSGYTVGNPSSAMVTVNDDDGTATAATLSISAPSTSANEGNSGTQTLTYTVTASAVPSAFTHWRVCFSGTAMRDEGGTSDPFATNADYRALDSGNALETSACTGTFQFGPSLTTTATNISIQVIGDTDIEEDETVVATLSFIGMPPAGVTLGTSVHTHTIENDDTNELTLTVASSSAAEGNTASRDVNVTVAKPAGSAQVSYSLCFSGSATLDENGTQAASEDYQVINSDGTTVQTIFGSGANAGCVGIFGESTFASNEDSETWKIRVFGDTDVESDETVIVTLKEYAGTPLPADFEISSTGNPATHTIEDDDTVDITIANVNNSVVEGDPAVFTITANRAVTANRTILLTVADEGSQDYVAPGDEGDKTVTINAGATTATYSVPTVDDNVFEGNGQVSLTVRADPANYHLPANPTVAYVEVTENETAPAYSRDDFLALTAKSTSLEAHESDRPNLHFKVDRIKIKRASSPSEKDELDFLTGVWGFRLCFTGTATRNVDYTVSAWNGLPLTIGADGCTGAGGLPAERTFIQNASHLRTARSDFYIGYVDDGHEDSGETIIVTLRDPIGSPKLFGDSGVSYGKDQLTFTILNSEGGTTDAPAPGNCVSAGLQSKVEGYAKEGYGAAHVARWKKVLKTFAGETGGMTGTEARQMEKTYSASRWQPVAEAIECLEAESQPASVPEIAVSGSAGVTEGDPASFTVTANPAPAAPLTVSLTVYQSGDVAAAGAVGSREVVVPTSGSVTLDIATVDDGTDEPDGSITATLAAGDGYTVAASPDDIASVAVADDDTAVNAWTALIAKMYTWRNDPQWASHKSHTDRWDRALLAFGESVSDSTLTPMTAAEAQAFADRGMTRWVEVAKALHEIESGGTATPDPVPVVTVSGGAGVTEGDPASFTVTANPAPAAPLTVTLTVGQSGDVATAGATGSREVTIPTGGSVTLDIATVDDAADEPDGSVSVTVDAGNGYTVGSANAHTVSVADDDAGPAIVPELSLSAGAAVDEGGNAEFTINASPAPQAALTVAFTVAQSGDYLSAPTPASRTVTLAAGAASTTLTLATVEDGTDEADGSVSVTIDAGNGYTVAAGQDTGTVAVRDNDEPVVSIAAGAGVTEGDPASFTVTANPTPAAPLTVTLTVGQSGDVAASGQTGSREVIIPTGGSVTVEVATDDDSADEPDGSITATLDAGSGYTVAASPDDTASVAVADNDEAAGVPSLSVVDGEANENEGRLPVVIRLSPPSKGKVTVWARTRESSPVSARAGVDYRVWNARWGIRIDFRPGETERRLAVRLLNDSHDEDAETFEVVLSDPSGGAAIADGTGTMTIVNSDPMPAAWLARFGRTVAEQALDGIAGRMAASRTAGAQGTIAGQALSFGTGGPGGSGAANDNAAPGSVGLTDSGSLAQSDIARAFGTSGNAGFGHGGTGSGFGFGSGTGGSQVQSQGMTGLEALLGSSFTATGEKDGTGGSMAFWGRAAQSRFDGREGTFSLDGEATTAMLGADYARGKWLVGMALMQSNGEGGYADSRTGPQECPPDTDPAMRAYLCDGAVREGDGKVEASLTAAVPYAAIQASEGLKLWGALGYGMGEVTLKPELDGALKSDISWTMASMGLRGDLLPPPKEGSGPALAVTSDALWARTSSEKTGELAASDSDVTRLRLGLEGSWRIATEGGGSLTPKLEVGARHDGGDAETGFGVEVGGGLAWMDPTLGLSLDLSGRTLVAHGSDDLEDRGFAASLAFDPNPASARGPSLTLTQDWGGQAQGGLDALFRTDPLADRTGGGEATSRWQAEAAWGFPAFSGRFTGSPHVGLGLATGARDYSLGWRLTPAANANAPDVSFGLKATRRESDTAAPEHTLGFEVNARW